MVGTQFSSDLPGKPHFILWGLATAHFLWDVFPVNPREACASWEDEFGAMAWCPLLAYQGPVYCFQLACGSPLLSTPQAGEESWFTQVWEDRGQGCSGAEECGEGRRRVWTSRFSSDVL